jgi:hypothetical protein
MGQVCSGGVGRLPKLGIEVGQVAQANTVDPGSIITVFYIPNYLSVVIKHSTNLKATER